MALGTNNPQAKPSVAPWAIRKNSYTSHLSLLQLFYRHRKKQYSPARSKKPLVYNRRRTMSFRIAPQQSTRQASRIRKLIKDLGKKLENSYPGRSDYIPEEDLGKTIMQNVIGEWLKHSSPDATNPTKLKSEIYCKGLKTFCILVSMEKEQCMKTFMDKLPWGPDRKLPWTSQENLKSFLDAPHLDWDRNAYVEFFEQQRRYQPHEISEGEMRRLDKDLTVIPYLEECKDMKRGDIVKVKLDRRYFKPSSTRELGAGGFVSMHT